MEKYNPDVGAREPIKPLRLKDEHPGGLLGVLRWFRARGGVFWFTFIGTIVTVIAMAGIFIPYARTQGQLDFRSIPDMAVTSSLDKTTVSPGDTLIMTFFYENLGASTAGAVTINISIPDELTAVSVLPGTPGCSQANARERFSSMGLGDITGKPGGIMMCLLGTREGGTKGEIVLETKVGEAPSGTILKPWAQITSEQTRNTKKGEKVFDNNLSELSVTVQ